VIAVLVGGLVATVLYWLGAVVAFVGIYGIPLGASPGPTGPAYYTINLGFAALAAVVAGWVAAYLARSAHLGPVGVLAVSLAGVALWGFTKPASHWPEWYAPVLALIGLTGALAGGVLRAGRARGQAPE
jgi:hypothetical protein